ncbi:S1C family serine protease [Terrimonas ferruginea]|uniref:S1C family serine protease n=1 Tax=Terrimonas ferruginea TaxID=249 RepID=UPI000422AE37|nr:trypsin-like peptidase domain-containing protein [Terrimonas ferruginea]
MKKIVFLLAASVMMIPAAFAQKTSASKMLDKALSSVVTVAVYESGVGNKTLGFRGNSSEMAYARALDLTGAQGSGSGFVIQENGKYYVITNAHVIESAADKKGSIYVYSINYTKYEAKIVGGDSFYDLAVLEFTGKPGAEITSIAFRKNDIDVGEPVYAIGNPLGDYPYSVSEGIISAKNRVRGGLTGKFGFLQTTATVIWGNSGGPLVDANGEVAGINSQIAFADRGDQSIWQPQINFALEAGISRRLITDILTNKGLVKRAYIGVEIAAAKPNTSNRNSLRASANVETRPVISGVVPGSPAAAALASYKGYVVEAVNGQNVRSIEEVLGQFEKTMPGQDIQFRLSLNGSTQTVKVTTRASNATTMTSISDYVSSAWGGRLLSGTENLTINFNNPQKYAAYRNQASEGIWYVGNTNNSLPSNTLFSNDWIVIAAGIISKTGGQVWRVSDAADLAAALRLGGSTGIIDLVLFRKGGNPEDDSNYIQKRFVLSGSDAVFKQTLWY